MASPVFFEIPCPECKDGMVRTTRVLNYKTKIKGYPFIVDEAFIGICDQCGAKVFAAQETDRWEQLFYRSMEERHLFLAPEEITALRKSLHLSMEDFARLIGCTRQSLAAWERADRTVPPSRMADLLMKLVQRSFDEGRIDVLAVLLEEAKAWGLHIEVQTPPRSIKKQKGHLAAARVET